MTDSRAYWVVTFTLETWEEALAAGGNVVGFRASTVGTVDKIAIGDYLLCYIKGISRFIAVQKVDSKPFLDDSPIWNSDQFPFRIMVKTIVRLEPDTAVPVIKLKDRLSIFKRTTIPGSWGIFFRPSPRNWNEEDGRAVVEALRQAHVAATQCPPG